MTEKEFLKQIGFNGSTHPLSKEQKQAGVAFKLMKNAAFNTNADKEYWTCAVFLDSIHTDSYQRSLDKSHKNKICQSFQPYYTNTPVCSLRTDGKFRKNVPTVFVDDGQHTLDAIKEKDIALTLNGKPVVLVSLAFDMTYADAAAAYHARNSNKKKINGWNKFTAAYESGDPLHVQIINMAKKYKLSNPIHDKTIRHWDLKCPDLYVTTIKEKGILFLDKLFKLHSSCWKGQSHDATFLRSFIWIIYQFQKHNKSFSFDDRRFVDAFCDPTIIAKLDQLATEIKLDMDLCKMNETVWKPAIGLRLFQFGILVPNHKVHVFRKRKLAC